MSASEELYGKVVRVLAESFSVEEGHLTPSTTLQGDLGGESIDFLELLFRLEHEFGIDIPDGELFPRAVFQGNSDFLREGRLTDHGMNEIQSRMPYADLRSFEQDRRLSTVTDLFTVDLVVRYIAWKLSKNAGAGTDGIGGVSIKENTSPVHQEMSPSPGQL